MFRRKPNRISGSICTSESFYHAGGDHFFKPLGLSLVVEIDAAHQVVSCRTNMATWRRGQRSDHEETAVYFKELISSFKVIFMRSACLIHVV